MNLSAMMSLDAAAFTGPLDQANSKMGVSMGSLGGMIGKVAALGGAYLSLRGIMGGFEKGITLAADTQDAEIGFKVLLGSAAAAQERVEELTAFGASTPFELPGILAASKKLETLTRGALSTGAGLVMVGDLASAADQPIEEMATTVGRLYDGLQSGRPVGEAMMRLQELGMITGDTRARIEAMQKSGAAGEEVWAVAAGAFERFSGMMEQKSAGWNGLFSTFKDGVNDVFRQFGQPVMEGLTGGLQAAIGYTAQLAPIARAFGENLVGGVKTFIELFKSGQIGQVIMLSMTVAFGTALNFLATGLSATADAELAYFMQIPKLLVSSFKTLISADFWAGIAKVAIGSLQVIGASLIKIFAKPIDFLQAAIDVVINRLFRALSNVPGLKGRFSEYADAPKLTLAAAMQARTEDGGSFITKAGRESDEMGRRLVGEGAAQFMAATEEHRTNILNAGLAITDAFADKMREGVQLVGTGDAKDQLAGIFGAARDSLAEVAPQVGEAVAASMPGALAAGGDALGKAGKSTAGQTADSADRLAKIGLFVGGGQGAAQTRVAERTARATEKLGELMKQLINKDAGTPVAAWA